MLARITLSVAVALALSACTQALPPQNVSIFLPEDQMYISTSQQATAEVSPATANQQVVWSSSDESVAVVSAAGVVTAMGMGTVEITVTSAADPSVSDSAELMVLSPLSGRTILYYVDYVSEDDLVKAALDLAFYDEGAIIVSTSAVNFLDNLALDPYLVIYVVQDGSDLPAGHLEALLDWVADDGRLAFSHWLRNNVHALAVWGALRVAPDDTYNHRGQLTVTDSQLALGLTSTSVDLHDRVWAIDNIGLDVLGGGTAWARYEGGTAAIVGSNEDRTAAIGFLTNVLDVEDGVQLYLNVFYRLALAGFTGFL